MARLAAMLNTLEEADRVDKNRRRRALKMARYLNICDLMDDHEFIKNYRLNKGLFEVLVRDLTPYLQGPRRSSDLTIKYKVLATLSFLATGSYQKLVGRSNGTTMSQQSVSKCIREVTDALNHPNILKKYINFPGTREERSAIKLKFYEKYKIPGVIGCIDGTQVAMIRPAENEEWYFNRKHYHSRNVQIICDFDLNIISIDACYGGATHDSHIFNNHEVKNLLESLINQGEIVCLLGDSGYAQREYMMTPLTNTASGSPEEHYTRVHSSARNRVERTIGLLKARWRCLLKHRVLHYKPDRVAKIINACAVLHNICNHARVPTPSVSEIHQIEEEHRQESQMSQASEQSSHASSSSQRQRQADDLRRGNIARARIVEALWLTSARC